MAKLSSKPPDTARVVELARLNRGKLDNCAVPHDLRKDGDGVFAEYRCTKCGGLMSNIAGAAYRDGVEHERKRK